MGFCFVGSCQTKEVGLGVGLDEGREGKGNVTNFVWNQSFV